MLITEAATSSCTTSQDQDRQFCSRPFFLAKKYQRMVHSAWRKTIKMRFIRAAIISVCYKMNETHVFCKRTLPLYSTDRFDCIFSKSHV